MIIAIIAGDGSFSEDNATVPAAAIEANAKKASDQRNDLSKQPASVLLQLFVTLPCCGEWCAF